LVTGSSSGIGAAFARQLASQGYDLVLVARREDRLTALAAELQQRYNIAAEALMADLFKDSDIQRVETRIVELNSLDMLVNNAGFGTTQESAKSDLGKQVDMIQVHVIASVRLSRAALPGMIAAGCGAIINVSSMSASLPLVGVPRPGTVTYSATKAYLLVFSQALQAELRGTGVKVQALCPGFTHTEFHDTAEYKEFNHSEIPEGFWMSAEEVVTESLNALKHGKVVCIPGFKNRMIIALLHNSLTSPLVRLMAARTFGERKQTGGGNPE
jgi:short-subunit dehydrogenase